MVSFSTSTVDIRWIDFVALREAGYRGVCFDKDNTLTHPYSKTIYPPLQVSLEECKRVFEGNIAIISNSAGSADDVGGEEANLLESSLGIPIIRHRLKKPICNRDIEKHFQLLPPQIVLIGDRLSTDVYMANAAGMLSIHTQPISLINDNKNAVILRRLENSILSWSGLAPSRPDLQLRFIRSPGL